MTSRYFYPIWGPFVLRLRAQLGLITSRDPQGVPIFERYFVGGIYDVRGFRPYSWGRSSGRRRADPGLGAAINTIGGNMQVIGRAEIEFPLFEKVGIRGVVFADAGNAFNLEDQYCRLRPADVHPSADPCVKPWDDLNSVRTSWGFGFRWFSPIGPLRFEWGLPFKPLPGEEPIVFEFTIGNDSLMAHSTPGMERAIDGPAKKAISRRSEMKRLAMRMVAVAWRVLAIGLWVRSAAAEEVKLGYVDLQRALNETEDGRKAKADLKKVFDQKQKELDEQQNALKKAIEDLDKRRTLLGADVVKQKEAELQGQMQKVQQTYMRHQQDLSGQGAGGHRQDLRADATIIAKIATTENFSDGLRPHPGRPRVRQAAPGSHQRGHPPLQRRRGQRRRRCRGQQAGARQADARQEVSPSPGRRMGMDIRDIEAVLPHRYPFLLVDRVESVGEDRIVAHKLVSRNEPHFDGHFPGNPVMPGVLIIEALAQAGAMLAARLTNFDPTRR